MSQPVIVPSVLNNLTLAETKMPYHLWVTSGSVFGIPMHQIIGLFSPSNAELTTKAFIFPESVEGIFKTIIEVFFLMPL